MKHGVPPPVPKFGNDPGSSPMPKSRKNRPKPESDERSNSYIPRRYSGRKDRAALAPMEMSDANESIETKRTSSMMVAPFQIPDRTSSIQAEITDTSRSSDHPPSIGGTARKKTSKTVNCSKRDREAFSRPPRFENTPTARPSRGVDGHELFETHQRLRNNPAQSVNPHQLQSDFENQSIKPRFQAPVQSVKPRLQPPIQSVSLVFNNLSSRLVLAFRHHLFFQ